MSGTLADVNALLQRYVRFGFKVLTARGFKVFATTVLHFVKAKAFKLLAALTTGRDAGRFIRILGEHPGRTVLVTRPLLDWDVPLFQRPHHLALNLSRCGFLYFYCTDNWANDNILGFRQLGEQLFLTNRADVIDQHPARKVHVISSTDNYTGIDFVERELAKGNLILYEYLDEIHDQISGLGIPQSTYIRHAAILKDERCMVIATADKLYRDVQAHRSRNFALVTNGVECGHFARSFADSEMPDILRPIAKSGRKIIGYFGALASWFDYELVLKIVRERPEYEVVLIGFDYDGSSVPYQLDREPRVHVIGPFNYRDLPRYAYWFDVATIPFLINDITESTSPIKLFEYMALGKPIVTTAMPECRKYRSVLVAESHAEFVAMLDTAMKLRSDQEYLALLQEEALANSWESKAEAIAHLIRENLESSNR